MSLFSKVGANVGDPAKTMGRRGWEHAVAVHGAAWGV